MVAPVSPYIPSSYKSTLSGSKPVTLTYSDVIDTNFESTSSFLYDLAHAPLKSTQQISIDWSKFENHTFFSSAEVKTNVAFDTIINNFPFDGTKVEYERFFENLTGFEKYVYDQFPKYKGQLHFSGTQVGEDGLDGTYIIVKDHAGTQFPDISKNKTGDSKLNPGSNPITIEFNLYLPEIQNGIQVICQKLLDNKNGYIIFLENTSSTSEVTIHFSVVNNTNYLDVSGTIEKGRFNHIAAIFDNTTNANSVSLYNNTELLSTTTRSKLINSLTINNVDFIIGSGSQVILGSTTYTPTQTLSGSIDEFRLFHSIRTQNLQKLYMQKSLYTNDDLKLYFKFNEPQPKLSNLATDTINSIVLDSSGNSLHSYISNFFDFVDFDINGVITGSKLRQDATTDSNSLMIYEKEDLSPILFPGYPAITALNSTLLYSASLFDRDNPNLVTKLIPEHYFLNGSAFEGFEEIEGTINDEYSYINNGMPKDGKLGDTQLLLSFLYIWSKYFDELKLFIDTFSNIRYVDYEENDTIPNNFLFDLVKQYGFDMPALFNNSSLEQYVYGENINNISSSQYTIKYIQQQLLRRVLINLPSIIRSKGTLYGIKAFLRSVGIDPDNTLRIKEYGGPTKKQMSHSREFKIEPNVMLKFTSGSIVTSPYLSSSRVEIGYPEPAGTFVNEELFTPYGISDNTSDGLLTSGSWTVEGIVKYPLSYTLDSGTQSIVRLCVTGSNSSNGGIIANLLLESGSVGVDSVATLYVRSGDNANSPTLKLDLNFEDDIGPFDGNRWSFCFGCRRNDDNLTSVLSSSYFIRFGMQDNGELERTFVTSSYFYEKIGSENNVFRTMFSASNASGSYIAIGTNQTLLTGSAAGYTFLNNTNTDSDSRITTFNGLMSNLKFWSKALTESEWREHILNYKSAGVSTPRVNYNFNKTSDGSFERLRLDTFTKQETRIADQYGNLQLLDFSLNENHMNGSGFTTSEDSLIGEIFEYSYLSPYFDEAASNEKIRVRSYQDLSLLENNYYAQPAPVYELLKSEEPTDDVRFSIDFSLIDALNRDIITMFSDYSELELAIGDPTNKYSSDYPKLENLRDVYFNRIGQKLNFKEFFEFYKWFDTSVGNIIEQLIPKKTKFKGINFIIESHMLERNKHQYYDNEIYLGEEDRSRIKDTLLLQQIVGTIKKR